MPSCWCCSCSLCCAFDFGVKVALYSAALLIMKTKIVKRRLPLHRLALPSSKVRRCFPVFLFGPLGLSSHLGVILHGTSANRRIDWHGLTWLLSPAAAAARESSCCFWLCIRTLVFDDSSEHLMIASFGLLSLEVLSLLGSPSCLLLWSTRIIIVQTRAHVNVVQD